MTKGPKYTSHNGFLMPAGFPVEHFDSALNYEVQDSDIIVATYPKCGTTWTQHIVYMMMRTNGQALQANEDLTVLFPHLEEVGAQAVHDLPSPRLIKTHLPYTMTPMNKAAKYICVIRNPKDCVVSYFHHTRGFIRAYDYAEGQFDDYFTLFLKGEVDCCDYFDHVDSWLKHQQDDHVLILTYESMKANVREAILKIGQFLGKKQALLEDDERLLKNIMQHSSFQSMSQDLQRWSSQRPEGHTKFIRKGIVGDWRNMLSHEQSKCMNTKIRERFSPSQIEELWGGNNPVDLGLEDDE